MKWKGPVLTQTVLHGFYLQAVTWAFPVEGRKHIYLLVT